MHIRPVQPTDHAEWLRMRLQLWGGTAAEHTPDIDAYFATPQGGVTFVVERPAGGLGGFIEVSRRNYAEGCTTSPVAYIEGWYVDKDIRRRHVGTRLVQAAEAWARRQGLQEIASDTQIDNTVSIHAHTALGYTEVDRIVCFRKRLDERGVSRGVGAAPPRGFHSPRHAHAHTMEPSVHQTEERTSLLLMAAPATRPPMW